MPTLSAQRIKAEALSLGFTRCGIAKAEAVDRLTADSYRHWIAAGGQADMHYLANNIDKRLDPTLLLPGAHSIIVVAMNYAPARRLPEGEYQIADYALGKDYHDTMKQRLRQLVQRLNTDNDDAAQWLVCVDTVPILERYWAKRAGLGFIGRNHQLIIPGAGSMVFLGEIVTSLPTDNYDEPLAQHCGSCRRCIDACPTGALRQETPSFEQQALSFDARCCLSYQTIENRGPIDNAVADKLGNYIYGCDRCQKVCPWNAMAQPNTIAELQPTEELLTMTRERWHSLSREDYQRLFKGSAVKRAKYEGIIRNIRTVNDKRQNLH